MQFFYNIFVSLLITGMKLAAPFNYKIKKGLAGRRQSCGIVKEKLGETKVIWMHAASLGEYEQGLPVLEKLKEKFPEHKVLITFFSPSGYDNVVKKQTVADAVCYLPFDTERWVNEFLSHFNPDIFFTVKYDFWYHLLKELRKRDVKVFVVSALFYETQIFFKVYGKWFVNQLKQSVTWFFHQTKHSTALAKSIGLKNSSTAGDTRFDRVRQLRNNDSNVPFIAEFVENKEVIVFGSSWEAEERIAEIVCKKSPDTKIIIAPHDLKRIEHLKTVFPTALLYSLISDGKDVRKNAKVLLIDCIGLLSKLYFYADVAVVGGGFHSKGLHNILEAATYGVPVVFGNQYKKNPEADELIAKKGGQSFEDEFFAAPYILSLLKNDDYQEKMGENAANFIHDQPNATEIVVQKIVAEVQSN